MEKKKQLVVKTGICTAVIMLFVLGILLPLLGSIVEASEVSVNAKAETLSSVTIYGTVTRAYLQSDHCRNRYPYT